VARTKGSISFCEVTLAELNEKFRPESKILVSIRFLRMNGMVDAGKPIYSNYNNVQSAGAQPEIQEVSIQEIKP
jgi:hypothetical protein